MHTRVAKCGKDPDLGLHGFIKLVPRYVLRSITWSPALNSRFSVQRWKITSLPVVPAALLQLANSLEWEKMDKSSIDTTGSGAIRENTVPGYKPTDSSVGLLMPGTQARIVREDGTDCGVGESGELWIKGGGVFQGYLNDKEATTKAFTKDGWLKTGGIFVIDEKQNF